MLHWYPNGVSFSAAGPAVGCWWEWSGLTSGRSDSEACSDLKPKELMLQLLRVFVLFYHNAYIADMAK